VNSENVISKEVVEVYLKVYRHSPGKTKERH
jgi:hypothetical protein